MNQEISLVVNGTSHTVKVDDHWTLLDLLHDALDLRGTKDGCGEGVCGACTVLVNGRAVRACLTLAAYVQGAEVVTIEGLARDDELDPVQRTFLELGAVQCGYCTPGMIMMAKALLGENPNPTRDEVREALAGNLCRCSGYTKIIDAVMAVRGAD
ncbi:MAG: (2Fe-2S)-binding protein [Chloroflexi bacterium]|nr:(2Fe-2S)-binding protein [Chloroflexota bacterium]